MEGHFPHLFYAFTVPCFPTARAGARHRHSGHFKMWMISKCSMYRAWWYLLHNPRRRRRLAISYHYSWQMANVTWSLNSHLCILRLFTMSRIMIIWVNLSKSVYPSLCYPRTPAKYHTRASDFNLLGTPFFEFSIRLTHLKLAMSTAVCVYDFYFEKLPASVTYLYTKYLGY